MKKFYYSMIIYVDNDELLSRSIESIFNVSEELWKQVRLIVVDPIASDLSKSVMDEWKEKLGEDNVCYMKTPNKSLAEAYNIAIPKIRGTYVNFSLASTWMSEGVLEAVKEVAEERERPKMISLSPWTINEKEEFLPYKMSPERTNSRYENIRFYKQPAKLQLMFHAYFIRTFLIHGDKYERRFRTELYGDAVMEMLMELLAEWRGYVYLPNYTLHYTTQLEDNTSAFLDQHQEWWYNDSFKNWILPFVQKWAVQHWPLEPAMRIAILYLVFARYNCNYNDRNKGVLDAEKRDELAALTGQILQYVDNDYIFKKRKGQTFAIPRSMRMLFLRLKAMQNNTESEVVSLEDKLFLWTHVKEENSAGCNVEHFGGAMCLPDKELLEKQGTSLTYNASVYSVERDNKQIPELKLAYGSNMLIPLSTLSTEHVLLNIINFENGKFKIDGTFSGGDFLEKEQIKLKLVYGENVYPVKYSEVYGLNRVFGVTYNHKYQFHVEVPLNTELKQGEMQFILEMNGEDIVLEIRANSIYAHIRHDIKGQYWKFKDKWSLHIAEKNKIRVLHLNRGLEAKKEMDYQNELAKRGKKGDKAAKNALRLRNLYFEMQEELAGQRIWISFDKLYKAGDNGEYMYDYIAEQKDGIDMRYIIKEDSPDYIRMSEKGDKLLVWGTEETLVTVLLAEAILTTHTNIVSYTGFDKEMIPYVTDLFNSTNICIQHGLTTQNIAQFQNRLFDNLQLYLCASPNEIQNLSRPIYGYEDKSRLKLVGIARYDGLKSNDKKQILITPTWRRNIANANVAHVKKGHNEFFKNSEYFRIYNSLINDPKLIECAKKTGYKLIYLLHPAASAQIDDFDRNDYVELIPAASDMNYEKILTESSLMVTDYSGVQFDFAYMRKPLVYYHPKTLPPHYDESKAYVYETDAFGPLVDNHEEMVNTLCEYMISGCKMKHEYVKRADKFFAFKDFKNRKRIYEAILEFLNEKNNV